MAETATQASQPTTTRVESGLSRFSTIDEVRRWLNERNFPHFAVRGQVCVRFALAPDPMVTEYLKENAFYWDAETMTWLHDCSTVIGNDGRVYVVTPAMERAAVRDYRARMDAIADYHAGLRAGAGLRTRKTSVYAEVREFEDAEEASLAALDELDASRDAAVLGE